MLSATSLRKRYNNRDQFLGGESQTSLGLHLWGRVSTGTAGQPVAEPSSARETKVVPLAPVEKSRLKRSEWRMHNLASSRQHEANLCLRGGRGTSGRWKPHVRVGKAIKSAELNKRYK